MALLSSLLLMADSLYRAWEGLLSGPDWLFWSVLLLVVTLSLLFGWGIRSLLLPRRKQPPPPAAPRDEESVRSALAAAQRDGVDVSAAEEELAQLDQQRQAPNPPLTVALFGEISSGKSSLIKALVTDAEPDVDVCGGTTRELIRYQWHYADGGTLELLDMPGLHEAEQPVDEEAQQHALRAHVVIYVCDGDLTRSQQQQLAELQRLDKPLILALNKSDRYRPQELQLLQQRLAEHQRQQQEVVTVSAGGEQELLRLLPNGDEEWVTRQRPPRINELRDALTRILGLDPTQLNQLRERAVFDLAGQKLEQAITTHREQRAAQIVESYTRRAVVGALAAIAPGSDLLIQGYLASRLIRELAQLYQVPIQRADTDLLLELVQKHVVRSHTLFLAVAGNALKAFPGIGTLAGSLVHAVAYGLIFHALGRSVARSLAAGGGLQPHQTAKMFKETPRDELETMVGKLAKMAVAEYRKRLTGSKPASPDDLR